MIDYLKSFMRPAYINYIRNKNRRKFKKTVALNNKLKLVVGSSGIFQEGWIPTEMYFLNLLQEENWALYFRQDSINNILAEHVWEHLTLEEGKLAGEVCYKYLKKTGRLRVAVPDGYHFSSDYIENVKIGGIGRGAYDHKVLYNYKTLSAIFSEIGFRVELLEYFDEDKKFQSNKWDEKDGFVRRSLKNDERNFDGKPNYTSLIVDAIKE